MVLSASLVMVDYPDELVVLGGGFPQLAVSGRPRHLVQVGVVTLDDDLLIR